MSPFDEATTKHLDAWIANQFPSEATRKDARNRMLYTAQYEPEYWQEQGWWKLYDHSKLTL